MPRLTRCLLHNRKHHLPMPDRGGRLFSASGETVDMEDPFYMGLLNDGSIKLAPEEKDEAEEKPKRSGGRKAPEAELEPQPASEAADPVPADAGPDNPEDTRF